MAATFSFAPRANGTSGCYSNAPFPQKDEAALQPQHHNQQQQQQSGSTNRSDPYEVLGVPRNATTEQIRVAYKRLSLQNHPDKVTTALNNGISDRPRITTRFAEISAAYELLTRYLHQDIVELPSSSSGMGQGSRGITTDDGRPCANGNGGADAPGSGAGGSGPTNAGDATCGGSVAPGGVGRSPPPPTPARPDTPHPAYAAAAAQYFPYQSDAPPHHYPGQNHPFVMIHPLMACYPSFDFTDPFELFRRMFGYDSNSNNKNNADAANNVGSYGGSEMILSSPPTSPTPPVGLFDTAVPANNELAAENNSQFSSAPLLVGNSMLNNILLPPQSTQQQKPIVPGSQYSCSSVASQKSSCSSQQQQQQLLPDGRFQTVTVTKGVLEGQEVTQTETTIQHPDGRVESSTTVSKSGDTTGGGGGNSSVAGGYLTDGSISTTNTTNSALYNFLLPPNTTSNNNCATNNSAQSNTDGFASDDTVAGDSENDNEGEYFLSDDENGSFCSNSCNLGSTGSKRKRNQSDENAGGGGIAEDILEIPPKRRRRTIRSNGEGDGAGGAKNKRDGKAPNRTAGCQNNKRRRRFGRRV